MTSDFRNAKYRDCKHSLFVTRNWGCTMNAGATLQRNDHSAWHVGFLSHLAGNLVLSMLAVKLLNWCEIIPPSGSNRGHWGRCWRQRTETTCKMPGKSWTRRFLTLPVMYVLWIAWTNRDPENDWAYWISRNMLFKDRWNAHVLDRLT